MTRSLAPMQFALLLTPILIALGCGPKDPPRAVPVVEIPDVCGKAAENLRRRGCPEWRPDFEGMCNALLSAGARFDIDCIGAAGSCAEVKECR